MSKAIFENCTIKKADIFANTDGLKIGLQAAPEVQYSESMFTDTIEVDLIIGNIAGGVRGKTLMEGLPLVGTEDLNLILEDAFKNTLEVNLNVNKVTPIRKDTQQETIALRLTSEEFIRNEEVGSAVSKRYDGKISEHIRKILTDNLSTEKELFIDETSNNYNFIGNIRKPLYTINWLAKKCIPSVDGKRGETAGYMFFETADGFHFRSIDSLFAQKHIKSYIFTDTAESDPPLGYDGKIIKMEVDNRFIANQKLRMGAYNTKLIVFDPFNCKYNVIEKGAFDSEEGTTHAGDELPVINDKFSVKSTRTTYMLKDTGTLPTGDVKEQVKKNKEEAFEVESILNQAIRRYNQFSIGSVEVDIAPDFSLHVGDCIFIDSPNTGSDKQETDQHIGGKYLIAVLKHAIRSGKAITKLGLIRDSFGREGKPHNSSMVN